VFHLLQAGGWLMLPIIVCSILALAIILERFWTLRRKQVIPPELALQVWRWHQEGQLTRERILTVRESSPLGRIFAAGLVNQHHSREVMKEAIVDTGRQVVADLEHYLNTLGTIAAITPLLGLLGTVTGMIKAFTVITTAGVGDPTQLAGGIAEALITTAAGLGVAIPSLIFHRYLNGLVDRLALDMEAQALKMVEVIQGDREQEGS
jgi:biopolymer transport protein ExbB